MESGGEVVQVSKVDRMKCFQKLCNKKSTGIKTYLFTVGQRENIFYFHGVDSDLSYTWQKSVGGSTSLQYVIDIQLLAAGWLFFFGHCDFLL